jgi:hypothetical protein
MLRGERILEVFFANMYVASGSRFAKLSWFGPVSSRQYISHPMVYLLVSKFPLRIGLDHDFFLPCGMAGFGGVWAGDSARPGITEQKNMVGPGFCPRRGDPHETRPIPPGTGITERGLVGLRFEEELQNEKPVSSPSVGLNYKAFVSDAGRQGFQAEERRQSGSLGSLFPSILPIPSSLSATDTSSSDLRRKGAKSNPDPGCASPTRCDRSARVRHEPLKIGM